MTELLNPLYVHNLLNFTMTTIDAAVDRLYTKPPSEDGIWVGVDFGTSNSCCAIWDSAGGRSKWMRFPRTLSKSTTRGKHGRTMPSAVLYSDHETQLVGQAAMDIVDEVLDAKQSHKSSTPYTSEEVSEALVTSIKRILGLKPQQIEEILDMSLPFTIEVREEQVVLRIHPLESQQVMYVTPLQVTASILREIRLAAQAYVDFEGSKKKLQVPGQGKVRNCVIGVPAHFGRSKRKLLEEACRIAGWDGHISTITESTAAAMAYGLFVSSSRKKHILVFDMGGGTTDLTFCHMSEETSQVVVAAGDKRLGGDDMDELLLQLVLEKHDAKQRQLTVQQRRYLLRACRRGKELLCGNAEEPPADFCTIVWDGERLHITQQEFNLSIESLIQRAHDLVQGAMERYASMTSTDSVVDEVVLVGGATRVPAVRAMLQHLFSSLELCTSVNAESAVAQGAAIQAALRSGLVPKHELRSALMLDALPHSIGVQMDNGAFLPILDKDEPLPAMGCATFALADVHQPGVTVVAVEDVGEELPLERIGEFTFLLRRLSEEELSKLGGKRTVDIGMTMETSGEFVVSVFDSNDPEHLERKRRYQQHKATGVELGYHDDRANKGSKMTRDETIMVACSVFLFLMYVLVKLIFHDPLEESAVISNRPSAGDNTS